MSTEPQLAAFFSRQRILLDRERDAEIQRSSLLLSNCSPKLLEEKGFSLGGLGIVGMHVGLGGKTLVELERPMAYHTTPVFPPHTFRPGDLARIEPHVSSGASSKKIKKVNVVTGGKGVDGVVYKVSETRIVLAVDSSDSNSEDLDLPEPCRLLKLANSVAYDRMEKAIDQLENIVAGSSTSNKSTPEMTRVVQVLLSIAPISEKIPVQDLKFFDDTLNASQQEAVKFALESPEVACIHGPPGTGKTHTLIEIIRQLTAVSPTNPKSLRLLVCGASNLSVDNILERLLALPPGEKGERLKVTRIGHPARFMALEGILDSTLDVKAGRSDQAALAKDVKNELDVTLGILSGKGKGVKGKRPKGSERKKLWEEVKALRKEYRQREGGVVRTVLRESQIVLSTCHSAGGRQLRDQYFDVILIDEATQALEATCWIPILKAKKVILAGDPMQLPPTILSLDKGAKMNKKGTRRKSNKSDQPKLPPVLEKQNLTENRKESPVSNAALADLTLSDESSSDPESSDNSEMDNDTAVVVSKPSPSVESTDRQRRSSPVLRPPRTLETTLFDRLEAMYGPSVKRMLNVQYRMHSQICDFPSRTLYSSKLESHPSVASHLLLDLPNVHADSEEDEKELLGTPVVFLDTAGCEYFERVEGDGDEGSRCNENEAAVVKGWVDKLIGVGIMASQIAVITPYQAQVTLLTTLLRPIYGTNLEIGTVDGMQGREKEAIVISLVRSNQTREVGFLKDKRRLNVAMTRAKRHLCVVGDSSTVSHGSPFLKKWLGWLDKNVDVRYAGLE